MIDDIDLDSLAPIIRYLRAKGNEVYIVDEPLVQIVYIEEGDKDKPIIHFCRAKMVSSFSEDQDTLTDEERHRMENYAIDWIAIHDDVDEANIRFDSIQAVVVRDNRFMIRDHKNI